MFPKTEEDFEKLWSSGKAVVYTETVDKNSPPDISNTWSFWSVRMSEDMTSVATWRKIVTLEEANVLKA